MNIHPIFVHFPIALFTFYSIAEIIRFNAVTRQSYWFYVKALLVITGFLAAIVTVITGGMAEDINVVHQPQQYIEAHSTMAGVTVGIFFVISLCYFLAWLNRSNLDSFKRWNENSPFMKRVTEKSTIFVSSKAIIIAAILGLIAITITGTLGGALAYGVNNDPFTKAIAPLFFKN